MANAAAVDGRNGRNGRHPLAALLIATLATLALWLPATARAADVGTGTAVASDGITVEAMAITNRATLGFEFAFVIPTGTCVDAAHVDGVDLCKPWASLAVADSERPQGPGGAFANCSTLTNPTSWSSGYEATNLIPARDRHPNLKPLSGIYADVACDDGSGYAFYRLEIDDVSDAWGPWPLFKDTFGAAETIEMTWGDYKGVVKVGSSNDALEAIRMTVYGYGHGGNKDLLAIGSGDAYPAASDIVTTVAELRP